MGKEILEDLIYNVKKVRHEGNETHICFEVQFYNMLCALCIRQTERTEQQLKELCSGRRIWGSFPLEELQTDYGEDSVPSFIDIWKQPGKWFRLEYTMPDGNKMAVRVRRKDVERLCEAL